MLTELILLIGAGGHAKVVLDAMSGQERRRVVVRDDDILLEGQKILGHLIETPALSDGIHGAFFHLAIGNAIIREALWKRASLLGANPYSIIHPSAVQSEFARIEAGSFFAAGSVIGPSSTIGSSVIINHGAVVDHDCVVGDFSHIAPNATLGGGVRIGKGVLVGAGANVLPGIEIADRAIIGAGAVVLKNVAAGEVWAGVPAGRRVK
jgi:sugar O-acyltransferase (sialic acid O-acetyltransferase NeuD family)